MINFDYVKGENTITHNPELSHIPDHPYKILITGSSGSRKASTLFKSLYFKD